MVVEGVFVGDSGHGKKVLFASKSFKRGDLIFCEKPLLSSESLTEVETQLMADKPDWVKYMGLLKTFCNLGDEEKRKVLDICDPFMNGVKGSEIPVFVGDLSLTAQSAFSWAKFVDIAEIASFLTLAHLKMVCEGIAKYHLYPYSASVAHNCIPNASWNRRCSSSDDSSEADETVIVAISDIAAGTLITMRDIFGPCDVMKTLADKLRSDLESRQKGGSHCLKWQEMDEAELEDFCRNGLHAPLPNSICVLCLESDMTLYSKWDCDCISSTCESCIGSLDRCPFCRRGKHFYRLLQPDIQAIVQNDLGVPWNIIYLYRQRFPMTYETPSWHNFTCLASEVTEAIKRSSSVEKSCMKQQALYKYAVDQTNVPSYKHCCKCYHNTSFKGIKDSRERTNRFQPNHEECEAYDDCADDYSAEE